nr:MAG TPA: Poxvirus T4 protein, N terminus [Caudoviricetes sp.]
MYLVAIFYRPITESNGFAIYLHFCGAALCVNCFH